MASIKDVADLANVSPATVSRVINGTANVAPEKVMRVKAAIKQTGFVPNEVARSLFKKSAKLIGLILPSIDNPYFTQLASIIQRTADKHGYRIVLFNTDDDLDKEKAAVQMLASMNADGIILTTSNDEIKNYSDNYKIPIVVTDRSFNGCGDLKIVHCDHYQGGRLAAEHLIECGCKSIVCIKGQQHISSARDRFEGYCDVCRERGIREQSIDGAYDFDEGLSVASTLLDTFKDVDGIIACNDMVALSVFKVLYTRGIKVPEQVQLIGFDDIALASLVTPEISTIAQPVDAIGAKAAELIVFKDSSSEREYIFEAELKIRDTTRLG